MQRRRTQDRNPNGNAGRYYYICIICKNDVAPEDQINVGWSTWHDYIGVHDGNPHCNCGEPSRRDRMNRSGQGFWTCATGGCSCYSSRRDGHTAEDLYFENRGNWSHLVMLPPRLRLSVPCYTRYYEKNSIAWKWPVNAVKELLELQNETGSGTSAHNAPVPDTNAEINMQGGYYGNTLQAASCGFYERVRTEGTRRWCNYCLIRVQASNSFRSCEDWDHVLASAAL